ncbi:hypothetical protein M3O96_15355 [Aquiflexum sp. TKW24L]|uniref:hypothetical protein n=1 Tax=Aquiflexum sp. TKW24L TaxID=2942212 RepID=UPI0020BF74E4|nr:hypothetical protein [Aquiflexum sp. TKW24L]MCL6260479.1 hypothetical protein [Aquiflexum sp. TKW24L]
MIKNSLSNTLGVVILLFLATACKTPCKDTLYELTEVSLVPRTSSGSGNSIWFNDDALPIDRLIINIKMVKPIQVLFNPSPDCPVVYKNTNPVSSFQLVSNEDFNVDYPAGKDLFEIASFTNLTQSFSKNEFVDNYVNQSNFGTFYFTFTESPDLAEMHSLKIISKFQNGSTLQSSIIPVLLTP